ncbi:MAG TPA: single-stranded DNA-binding protein [Saprospiraceae bacterium]|nr:single-stranded DNA-binding protein [Saprospiraceae bacterium]MCC6689492.1 single-stranded DNA-binding protein [Saprospiraceae bacterium]HMX85536.1 single-stranded DNA-binding protein [Saprospiraceae bacterium]HMZ72215.1 single-stranded DNA-binding protein [Saprospiraceae bacterium]HNA42520.1 single-stranded DNA-binding protein [Saprospiraceae bacterium]
MSQIKNNVQLIGYVGKDPEMISFNSDKKLVKMSIATSDSYQKNGEWKNETQWHNVVAWGRTADYIHQNVKKGNEVALMGKLNHRSYENKEGQTQSITEIVVNELVKISKNT